MADRIGDYGSTGSVYNGIEVSTPYESDNQGVKVEDFLQLMIAQLTNQDFLNPADDTQYVTQLAQFATMQSMQELSHYSQTSYVASLVGKTVAAAQSEVKKAGFTTKIVGSGNTVVSQTPAAKQSLPADGVIVIYTEQNEAAVTAKVPKLTGLSISGANRAAVNAGFNIKIIGATYSNSEVSSYRQSVVEGTEAEIGSVITVYFKSSVNVTDG